MKTKKQAPRLVSTGFIALDIVIGLEDPLMPRFYTGGTTGNITAALAYLGWQTMPISRLAEDEAGQFVKADLERWGANTNYLMGNIPCPTPIVVEKIFHGKSGLPKHRFLWTCPDCGAFLPSYRPILIETAEKLKKRYCFGGCILYRPCVSLDSYLWLSITRRTEPSLSLSPLE